jgi:iron complex outermembrane receptor protein
VGEKADTKQLSQELRFTSNDDDSRFDWIAGLYYKKDEIEKIDRFIGENFLGATAMGAANALSTLSGESRWVNAGKNTNYAAFGQIGFKFTDSLKLSVGVRYTSDEKTGNVTGTVISTADRFAPTDPRANVTIESLCRAPNGALVTSATGGVPATCLAPNRWTYQTGDSFTTPYGRKWSETTPQAILEWKQSEALFMYATISKGFKGGGFDDTPANIAQSTIPFNPETVTNYEIGFKANLLDRRIRLNADVFYMDYKNLQVTQTNAACLCNLTDNSAKSEIKGFEGEFEFAVTDNLRLSLAGSYVNAKYKNFLESAINPSTGQRLDSSGNSLQRTPKTQVSAGVDFTTGFGRFADALTFSLNYSWQGEMPWATDNIAKEGAYGLLDARIALVPADSKWSAALYGKNVTDELYRVNIIHFFGEEVSQFGPPRTFGLDVRYKF